VALMRAPAMDRALRACAAGNCEESIDLLEHAVRGQSGDFRLYYRLGVCYSGCCRPHTQVHPEMAVPYLRQALRLVGSDAGTARAAVLDQLGNALIERSHTEGAEPLRAAIDCHVAAAEAFESLGMAGDWARVEFNLGNSWCDLAEATGEDRWAEAVAAYEKSLLVRTRDKDPEHHAAALENLGTAYRQLAQAGKSIRCFRQALWIYTPAANPEKCAALHNNLGNTILSFPGDIARNARRALRHFDRALGLQAQHPDTRPYGVTQYNRAQAYVRLGDFKTAVTCFREAARAFQACGEERLLELIRTQSERIDGPKRTARNSASRSSSPAAMRSTTPSR
jgi:tetratricopeptide (TPR) repeat protein